ncbi:MAG: hypothetical protein IJZ39_08265 [Oscillospiraceae bacterium]|nr:hypothetical protein [Oscillospiraceae bacterium]
MKKAKLSLRETIMLLFLVVLLIGVSYYMGFYTPLQNELASIASQSADCDSQITTSMAKISRMNEMQEELDQIFARPEEEITEIAPYDNKEVVLNQLYGILSRTSEYSLNFTDPDVQKDGTVRRNISMSFHCTSYEAAKDVIRDLTDSQWRCLVSNLAITSNEGNMMESGVTVTVTITFFESTKLS